MSFILDALRKSEAERQRGAVPGIAQIPFAAPRQTLPKWALAVIGALGLAVLGLGAAWWSTNRQEPTTSIVAAPVALPAPDVRPPTGTAAPTTALIAPPAAANGAAATPARERSLAAALEPVLVDDPPAPARPATEPVTARPEPAATASPAELLPSTAALAAEGIALPKLVLELHVFYRDRPADRLVIINGVRYREGSMLREGPELETIDAAGAVLRYQGRRFLLTAQ